MKLLVLAVTWLAFLQCCNAGGLLIPLYSWPDTADGKCVDPDYTKVATSAASHKTIVIVNPANGPKYPNNDTKLAYDTCIAYLRSHGVEVLGYVHTKLGYPSIHAYRPMSDVKTDIDQWFNNYTVDGIFIDEVTNRWPAAPWDSETKARDFYQAAVDYIFASSSLLKSTSRVVLNPGGVYFESIMKKYKGDSRVIAVVFEDEQWKYQVDPCTQALWTTAKGSFKQGPFCKYVPDWDGVEPLMRAMDKETGDIAQDQSAVMIYGANWTATDTKRSFDFGRAYNVGWYYVTERRLPNPWDGTPGDAVWNEQVSQALKSSTSLLALDDDDDDDDHHDEYDDEV